MAKSNIKRIRHLEDVVMCAGFLIQKLEATYGANFGVGMSQQVKDCLRDVRQINKARTEREAREAAQQSKGEA